MIAGVNRRRPRITWRRRLRHIAIALLCVVGLPSGASAGALLPPPPAASAGATPEIALIIDDMGSRRDAGLQVLQLPGPVACAFLPYAPYTHDLALQAHARNKEIMLHLPMQTVESTRLDSGGVTLDMTEREFLDTLRADLARVPHVSGINNHMGSLITRHPGHMLWLMRGMQGDRHLFFVDSRTTKYTVARHIAYENQVPSVSRDVFLDAELSPASVRHEFERLLDLAKRNGSALGIGHPHPATLALLRQELTRLSAHGVKLVPVSRLVQRQQARDSQWRASLSP
ncbi:MAG: divergent polysaccharide deacetylase family protein [Gammaproteobacteria bacterium]|nr:divergent polysaccharide deacetylase family protein [Gammaproteobacteria bacterium]